MSFDASAYVTVGVWEPYEDDDDDENSQDDKEESGQTSEHAKTSLSGPGPQPEKSKADLRQSKVFRKIEQDLKHRKKNASKNTGPLNMESYVDKDRAIAVHGGAEDLKGHVMKLRGDQLRSNRHCELEALGINVIIEQAAHELKYGEARKALHYMERGIMIKPDDVECLILKSKCLLEMNKYKEAMEDADKVLMDLGDSLNSKALAIKGDALYNLGNFEHALLNYHRATRNSTTKEKEELQLRITRTEIAVDNSVGPNAAKFFSNLEKFLNKIPNNIMGLPWFQLKTVVDGEVSSKDKNTKTRDRKFLSEMASDKQYLERILNRLSAQKNTQTRCHVRVKKHAEEALSFLMERRDFWAQQNPEYPEVETEDSVAWKSMVSKAIRRPALTRTEASLADTKT